MPKCWKNVCVFQHARPAFGLQLVYNDREYPELVVPVRDGDAVLMPSGYHPMFLFLDIPLDFCGRWLHTAKKKTVNSV